MNLNLKVKFDCLNSSKGESPPGQSHNLSKLKYTSFIPLFFHFWHIYFLITSILLCRDHCVSTCSKLESRLIMMHQLSEDKLMAVSLEVRRSDTKYLLLAEASHG